jgi:photosystem II stability/assembly factor-like uncharacterized protein
MTTKGTRTTTGSRTRSTRGTTPPARRGWTRWLAIGGVGALAVVVVAVIVLTRETSPASGGPTSWSRLGTQDVHALRFVPGSTERLLFGHHEGILMTSDGGRAWTATAARSDAMSLAVAGEDRLVIAGHGVFQESTNGGTTWSDIPADLPSLDIHAFAQSAVDPEQMWAYIAGGGLYSSTDGGTRWSEAYTGDIVGLVAVSDDGADVLLGVDPFAGLIRSVDGGVTWTSAGTLPTSPVASLAATPDGRTILLGGTDGLYRSDDGGATWPRVLQTGTILATAISDDGDVLGAVTEETAFFRSDDGGASWPGPR